MGKRVELRAGSGPESIDVAAECDSLKQAKERARYVLSVDYARRCEMAEPFTYAAIYVNDELVWEEGA